MTKEELQAEMDTLPSQHSEFLIGWLMSQVEHLTNLIEERSHEEKRSQLEMVTSIKP